MRWSLQLVPYRVSARDGYGSDAEYRCPVVPDRTFRFPQRSLAIATLVEHLETQK